MPNRSGLEEIKPCPFCGHNDPYWDSMMIDEVEEHFLMCSECGCQGPNAIIQDVAGRLWNQRGSLGSKADVAVDHMITRLRRDARLANFICPFTETYALLTDAYCDSRGFNLEEFRKGFQGQLKFESWPKEATCPECQTEFPI